MRWLAILGVLAYRLFVRPFHRRVCLFDESCSAHAIRTFRTAGFVRGLAQVRARVRSCRLPTGACFVIAPDGQPRLLTATAHRGQPPPPRALAVFAAEAARCAANAATVSTIEPG